MALAMLVGNQNTVSLSLFSPGNTLAALLANNFPRGRPSPSGVGVLMYAALVLMGDHPAGEHHRRPDPAADRQG